MTIGNNGRQHPGASRVRLTPAAEIAPEAVLWGWRDRIALGALNLLVGDPGYGKSTLTIELVARASRGQLEGDLFGQPVAVALVTAEDAVAQVVRPRLEAAGANLDRVHIVTVCRDGVTGGLVLPDDTVDLAAQLQETGVRWLVVDPVVAHLPGSIDAHKDQHVRRAIAPLARLAEELHLAVVGIVHLNKTADTRAVGRVSGSIGFVAAARSVLLLGPDPEEREGSTRILVHWKCNVGPLAPPLRLRVAGRVVQTQDAELRTSGIAWCGEATGVSARDILGGDAQDETSAVTEATEFLREMLADGPKPAKEIRRAAREVGVSDRTLDRAKASMGIMVRRSGFGKGGAFTWEIGIERQPSGWRPMDEEGPGSLANHAESTIERQGHIERQGNGHRDAGALCGPFADVFATLTREEQAQLEAEHAAGDPLAGIVAARITTTAPH